jgi:hypothetical protein
MAQDPPPPPPNPELAAVQKRLKPVAPRLTKELRILAVQLKVLAKSVKDVEKDATAYADILGDATKITIVPKMFVDEAKIPAVKADIAQCKKSLDKLKRRVDLIEKSIHSVKPPAPAPAS